MCTGLPVKIDGKLIFARTMEFGPNVQSVLRYTPKGTSFQAELQPSEGSSIQQGKTWKADYSFMGPTVMGTSHLIEGFNENGLHVAGFYFPEYAVYQPEPSGGDGTANCIGPMDFIEFLLGTCASVDEACTILNKTSVCDSFLPALGQVPPLHWIIQQSDGTAVVVEYLNETLTIEPNPLNVLTNAPDFNWQKTNIRNYVNLSFNNADPLQLTHGKIQQLGQGSGMLGLPGDFTPPSRFIRAVALSQSVALPGAADYPDTLDGGVNLAWNLINNVNIPIGAARSSEKEREEQKRQGNPDENDYTQWVSVSDLTRLRYYFRTYDNQNIRVADLGKLLDTSSVVEISMDQEVEYQDVTP